MTYLRKPAYFQIEADNENIPGDPQGSPHRVLNTKPDESKKERKIKCEDEMIHTEQINNKKLISINIVLLGTAKHREFRKGAPPAEVP